jgi:REP element-mobilizing transposase RayT
MTAQPYPDEPDYELKNMKGGAMPRPKRIKSATGYYHIYNRGVGKQILFEASHDFLYFLKLMKEKAEEYHIEFIAYCLMENHFHFLLK